MQSLANLTVVRHILRHNVRIELLETFIRSSNVNQELEEILNFAHSIKKVEGHEVENGYAYREDGHVGVSIIEKLSFGRGNIIII